MEERSRVILSDQREICLEDEDDLLLVVQKHGERICTCLVDYPTGGYGGGRLFVSPLEQYLIFAYFSGQSEEAFVLYQIGDHELRRVYASGYRCGEEADYLFSDDEEQLFQTLRTGAWNEESANTDAQGAAYYEFGEINLLDIKTRTFIQHTILVYPLDEWVEEVTDEGPFHLLSIENGQILHLLMPWGRETCNIPLESSVIVRPV